MTHQILQGQLNASGLRMAIVASRFNQIIVDKLITGALDALVRHGAKAADQSVILVSGAWEIPIAVQRAARTGKFDAIIPVGVVIKGATQHFEYVAGGANHGIMQASLSSNIPVTNGILTTNTLQEALERSGGTVGNYGYNSAVAAIETANLLRQIE